MVETSSQSKPSSAKRWLKRIGLGVLGIVVVGGGGLSIWVYTKTSAYNESVNKVYDVPLPQVQVSTDPVVIARGKHLTESLAPCANSDCHGNDLAGGKVTDAGPIGSMQAPNITFLLKSYSDGQLARLIRNGLKSDGRTVVFMPSDEWNWLPDSDVNAIISYLRTIKPVETATGGRPDIHTFGKVLDRLDYVPIDVARHIDHTKIETGPGPSATAEYGKWVAHQCRGCHGETHLSGGPIKGAPPDFPVPKNLTPDATGLKDWTFDDFKHLAADGTRKNGQKVSSFMPVEAVGHMDDTEQHALWAYLQSLPPVPFGQY